MAERTTAAVNKIMDRWDSVSQSIIENYKNGYINFTDRQTVIEKKRDNKYILIHKNL